jgi:hypothetical protein
MGFASLQRLKARRSASHGLCLPATFRLQGLATLLTAYSLRNPCRFCFAPAALLGFALRSLLLSRGIRSFPTGRTHLPFLSSVYPHTGVWGPARRAAVPGFCPSQESLAASLCLADQPLDAPLGFPLSGPLAEAWVRISPDLLSRALPARFTPRRRRPRVSINFCLTSSCPTSEPDGEG